MKNRYCFLLALLVIVLDQFTKMQALAHLVPYQAVPVLPLLNWTLAFNSGAAFSFLSQTGQWHTWFFLSFSILMSLGISVWILRTPGSERWQLVSLSLILGGAIGNLIDRIRLGHVIDFIDVFYETHHWPVFNLADTAISIGICLLLIELFFSKKT